MKIWSSIIVLTSLSLTACAHMKGHVPPDQNPSPPKSGEVIEGFELRTLDAETFRNLGIDVNDSLIAVPGNGANPILYVGPGVKATPADLPKDKKLINYVQVLTLEGSHCTYKNSGGRWIVFPTPPCPFHH